MKIISQLFHRWYPWLVPDQFHAKALAVNLLAMASLWAGLWGILPKLPPEVPWFYSLSQPTQQLVDKQALPLVFSFVSLLVLLDWWLSALVYRSNRLAARSLLVGSVLAMCLLAIGLVKVYLITT